METVSLRDYILVVGSAAAALQDVCLGMIDKNIRGSAQRTEAPSRPSED
ncbi:MAG: hypothetical protein L0Z62_44345 [Gemmataceae bacterium]|nr:hypothetical protein [Gemmataceae bacterium]